MKRIALYVLIGSVIVSALLGIGALLASEFGKTEAKVLLSSLCVTGASILALACAAAWPRTRYRFLPPAGIALSVAGFGLLILLIWTEAGEDVEALWKTVGTLLVLGGAATHAALLALARLTPKHAWALPAALGTNVLLAAYLVAVLWETWDGDATWRVLGILSILFGAFTILVPVFQRMGRDELDAEDRAARPDRVLFCPRCGASLDVPVGSTRCTACETAFAVRYTSSDEPSSETSSAADSPSS